MSKYDYVRYDEMSIRKQFAFKAMVEDLDKAIQSSLTSPRAKALAFTKLEECYAWIGKAIRDDQIARDGGKSELQDERTNS